MTKKLAFSYKHYLINSMEKHIVLLMLLFLPFSLFSQEICNNGIDDDGDGLIDLNDTADCNCSGSGSVTTPSLIPNPSFEDYSCCPSSFSQLNCADTWIQASDATSDYLNTCDYTGGAPLPLPDGNGAAGFISGIYVSTGGNKLEYLGACLLSPMIAGTQYQIDFDLAFGFWSPSGIPFPGPIDITIYGTPNCNDIPWIGQDCPIGVGGFIELGHVTYSPNGSWQQLSISFTPPININAIAIGGHCVVPSDYIVDDYNLIDYPYFFIDNLILNETSFFNPVSIIQTGNLCSSDLLLSASAILIGTYQWYFNGIAIVGQTNTFLDVSALGYGAGTYQVMYSDTAGCSIDSINVIQDVVIIAIDNAQNISCNGGADGSISITVTGGTMPYSYSWTGTGGYISTNEDITGLVAGTYNLTVNDTNTCNQSATISLTEPPVLTLDTSIVNVSCGGFADGSIDLTITGGTTPYSCTWTGPGGFTSTNEDISGLSGGIYSVTVTDATGCNQSAIIPVDEPFVLTPDLSIIDETCNGSLDGSIDLTITGGIAPYFYTWTGPGGFTSTSEDISGLSGGIYSVTVTDATGCFISDQATVLSPGLSPVITGNTTICAGNSTTLSVSSGYFSYLWSTGASSSSISVSAEGTYSVTVTDANGCSGSTQVTVQNSPPIYFSVFSNNADICPGEPVEINGVVTGGLPPYTLYDETGNVINFPYIVYPADTTTYLLSVQDACNELRTGNIDIIVYPVPEPVFTSDIIDGCQPLTVFFNEVHNYASYLWTFGDNSYNYISFEHNPQHTFQNSGTFDVSVTATNEYGCSASFTFPEMITVYPKPDAKFMADPGIASIIHPLVNFYNYSILNDLNYWSFGDGDSSLVVNPYHLYPDTGTYIVTLIVETQNGCKDTTMSSILIRPEITFYAPTAFSPDGDNLNDVFFVTGTGIDTANFHLYVYDRWGEVIFESDDIAKVWDGITADGKIAENGTYVWLCYYYDIFAIAHEETGQVMIIR